MIIRDVIRIYDSTWFYEMSLGLHVVILSLLAPTDSSAPLPRVWR